MQCKQLHLFFIHLLVMDSPNSIHAMVQINVTLYTNTMQCINYNAASLLWYVIEI